MVFILRLWNKASKLIGISWIVRMMGASFLIHNHLFQPQLNVYINGVTLIGHLDSFEIGTATRKMRCDWRIGNFNYPISREKFIIKSQWFTQSLICDVTSIKPHKWRGAKSFWLVKTQRCWKGVILKKHEISAHPSPFKLTSSIDSSCVVSYKSVNASDSQLWVALVNYRIEGGSWEHQFVAMSDKILTTPGDWELWLICKVRAALNWVH